MAMSRGDRAGEALADSPCYPARPRRLCRSSADGGRAGDSCPGQRPPRRPSAWLGAWLDAEPASHSPRVQAGEEAEEQQQLRGHAAAELGARGPRPRAGRHFLRNAVLALAASDAADCGATPAPSRRGRTGVGSGCQPRPRRPAGLRAAPRGALGTPGRRGAPPPLRPRSPPGPRRWVAGSGGSERSLAPQPEAGRCAAHPFTRCQPVPARWAARAVGSARRVRRRALGGGGSEAAVRGGASEAVPAGRSFPNYTLDNALSEDEEVGVGSAFETGKGAGSARARRLGVPAGRLRVGPGDWHLVAKREPPVAPVIPTGSSSSPEAPSDLP